MPKTRIVKDGEFLAQIALDEGFLDWRTLWNAPENQSLRDKRKDPNVLQPGDAVTIPDLVPKDVAAATGQLVTFEVGGGDAKLRIRVLDAVSQPVKKADCTFSVGAGDSIPASTDDKGIVERDIDLQPGGPSPIDGGLVFTTPALTFHLKIGALNHETAVDGQQARLNNLGYYAGFTEPQTDEEKAQFEWAVEEFQCDHLAELGLTKPTGVCDDKTQKLLVKVYGS